MGRRFLSRGDEARRLFAFLCAGIRQHELAEWAEIVRKVHVRRIQIFAYANNHYAGHAPATVREFAALLKKNP